MHRILAICHDGPINHPETPRKLVEVIRPSDMANMFLVLDRAGNQLKVHESCLVLKWEQPAVDRRES